MSEHRRSERHHIEFRVIFDDGESYNAAHVDDISETGMYFHSSTAVPPGSILRFEPAESEEDALFEAAARVVRCEPLADNAHTSDLEATGLSGIAVEFVSMTDAEREGIRKMIEHLESKKRQRSASGVRDPLLGVVVETEDMDNGQ